MCKEGSSKTPTAAGGVASGRHQLIELELEKKDTHTMMKQMMKVEEQEMETPESKGQLCISGITGKTIHTKVKHKHWIEFTSCCSLQSYQEIKLRCSSSRTVLRLQKLRGTAVVLTVTDVARWFQLWLSTIQNISQLKPDRCSKG